MTEGETKNCGACKTSLIHVKVTKTWNNKTEEKLQWQNVSDKKPHFMYGGEGTDGKPKYNCKMPQTQEEQIVQESIEQPKPEQKKAVNPNIKVNGPFDEAELITRWASERAYKIVMAEVYDYSKLSTQEKSALGQKTGMLTRCLVDTTIELMKMHGIKTNYGADAFD